MPPRSRHLVNGPIRMKARSRLSGAGVVGSATALGAGASRGRGRAARGEEEPGLCASGTNSGILHTGFDSVPGELETELILRAAELRGPVIEALGVPLAALRRGDAVSPATGERSRRSPRTRRETASRRALRATARSRSPASRSPTRSRSPWRSRRRRRTGPSFAPGSGWRRRAARRARRSPTRRASGCAAGRRQLRGPRRRRGRRGSPATSASRSTRARASSSSSSRRRRAARADPAAGAAKRTKGVLVFPTVDGHVIAGPDGGRRRGQGRLVGAARGARGDPPEGGADVAAARRAPSRSRRTPACARPGRGRQLRDRAARAACEGLVNVAAIRSTGLTASLGIAERVCEIVGALGVELGAEAPLAPAPAPPARRAVVAAGRGDEALSGVTLLLGIDEGTSAVKAVLFDDDLRPVAEARREKRARPPAPGLGGAGSRGSAHGGRRSRRRVLLAERAAARSPPAGSTTRASRCSPGTPRPASR